IDLVLERYRGLLKSGAILIDDAGESAEPRMLFYLEHKLRDARTAIRGTDHIVSHQLHFVEIAQSGEIRGAGPAPYLDYRPPSEDELDLLEPIKSSSWLKDNLESQILEYAVLKLVPEHLDTVRKRKEQQVAKT